ncbi:DUF4307 domain-containing protein [Krasilnikovia sp. MM14-A1004]|uniref:DUF4307 domain-containing protein n=1 Tax=Krasilnikovia sp. MM14-A1004 TaxID=3373541 RepID=UPI00399D2C4B
MSETHATAAEFPPGRYGRRRDGRRRGVLPIAVAVLVIAASVALSVRLYRQYGDPDYDAQIVRWSDVTDTRITIEFTVRVPPGGSASCALRARAYDGSTVGQRTVTVAASADATTIRAAEPVDTTARAYVGEVLHCQPPG